ncbi:hypothetical protein ACEY2D_011620, partial [Neisseria gonorrhoeae]|uniref:hypothetical protein n=1 Tax=Neisseria gonorrhoeae TaxID=485 RepID=UPI00374658E6
MNNYVVADHNHLEPGRLRSIEVEKSPGLPRGVKWGGGGEMTIRTIDASAIVPEGKQFGYPLKTEYANIRTRPANILNQW